MPLPLLRLRVDARLLQDIAHPGGPDPELRSVRWRGAFGQALKEIADGRLAAPPPPDWLARADLFDWLFRGSIEKPPDASGRDRNEDLQPWAIRAATLAPGAVMAAGAVESFTITLVGKAAELLRIVLVALSHAAQFGRNGGHRAQVLDVRALRDGGPDEIVWDRGGGVFRERVPRCPTLPPVPRRVRLHFETPVHLRIGSGRERRAVRPEELTPAIVLDRLAHRIDRLHRTYCAPASGERFATCPAAAEELAWCASALEWRAGGRWSGNTGQRIAMSGVVGWCDLAIGQVPDAWPALWLATRLNIGKDAAAGLGQVGLVAL